MQKSNAPYCFDSILTRRGSRRQDAQRRTDDRFNRLAVPVAPGDRDFPQPRTEAGGGIAWNRRQEFPTVLPVSLTQQEPPRMTRLLDEPRADSALSPAQQLRGTMAAVAIHFTWFGVRKTLNTEQKAQAADAFVVVDAGDPPIELILLRKAPLLHPILEPLEIAEHRPDLGQELLCLLLGQIAAVHSGSVADGTRLGK